MVVAVIVAALLVHDAPPAGPDLSWMAGYWLDCSGGRESSETWTDPRAGLSVGHAVTLSEEGPWFEVSHIRPTPEGLAYVAQPGGAPPTAFILVESGPSRAVFASPENDFPTRVIYEREGNVLSARIEGEVGGQARSMTWTFQAQPLNTRCPA